MGPNRDLTVLRFITFKDSPYGTPSTIAALEEANKKGNIVLLEGVKTGTAKVSRTMYHGRGFKIYLQDLF